jgi:apolipoprotein N-acyltransferase
LSDDAADAPGVGALGALGILRRPEIELAFFTALGALQTIAFVAGDLWPLQIIAIALLAWRVGRSSTRRAAALGFVFGIGWLCAGTWWMYVSMHRYGGLSAWLAALAVLALSAFLSLYLAAAMAVVARWQPRSRGGAALLFAAVWLLAELARGVILTGFPWVASGYAQVDSPLAGLASALGVYGIGAVVAGLAAAFGFSPLRRARAWLAPGGALVVALVAGALLGRIDYTTPTRALTISLLQGNVPQQEKFAPQYLEGSLEATAAQIAAARGELVVGPETVIPVLLNDVDDAYWTALAARFRVPGRAAILGIPMGDPEHGYTNSALGLSIAATAMPGGYYRYDKHHLVPFGEFVPDGFHWFTRMMNIPLGDFNRGPVTAPVVRRRRRARRSEHLLRGPVRRGARGALRPRSEGADDPRQPEQHRLVRQDDRRRAAPAHLAHALARAAAADDPRHQHRRHRGDRPPRRRHPRAAAVLGRHPRGHGRRPAGADAVRRVGRSLRPLAALGDRRGLVAAAVLRSRADP